MEEQTVIFTIHKWCMNYAPVVWLHVISHAGIAIPYFVMPLIAIRYLRKQNIQFTNLPGFWLVAAFVLACGTTHAFAIWTTLIKPHYLQEGIVLMLTAAVSIAAMFLLPPALNYVSNFKDLDAYRKANHELRNQLTAQGLQLEELTEIVKQSNRAAQIERREIIEAARETIQRLEGMFGTISNAVAAKSDPDNS